MAVDTNTLQALGLSPAATAAASGTRTANNKLVSQDQFLKLMTAQLNNQNPMSPQDSTQFLSQMAQFSMVSGIQDLQSSFNSFSGAIQQNQSLSASNLVGHSASVASDKAMLPGNGTLKGEMVLPAAASAVTLRITDSNGTLMKVENLGPQSQGNLPFAWDGTQDGGGLAQPGLYTVKAEAVIGGQTTALTTQATAPVTGVTLGGAKGMQVELQGLGSYALSDIQSVN